jgi:hypothetical protein
MNVNGAMMPFGVLDQAVLDALQTQSEPMRAEAMRFLRICAPDIEELLRNHGNPLGAQSCPQRAKHITPCQVL